MFYLYTSNRLEHLAQALADTLAAPLTSCFDSEIILVQNSGMARWVSLSLAKSHGIFANGKFYFPNGFIDTIFSRVLDRDVSHPVETTIFDAKIMTWRIMGCLPNYLDQPGFEMLTHYLQPREDGLKKYQLSEKIAGLFEQYVLFRPEMILAWEAGQEDHWQAQLWRELSRDDADTHRTGRFRCFRNAIARHHFAGADLPQRISVFGISALPRFHMEVLYTFSELMRVNLFLLNPCQEYWGDILSDRDMTRVTRKSNPAAGFPQDLHLERGNALLASMGTLGRDFFELIHNFDCQESSLFSEDPPQNLLHMVQNDILTLSEARTGIRGRQKRRIAAEDISIRIHACHSPMREVEVLHDNLLQMFEAHPDWSPSDILVMTPDIEGYAPYINAVFDVASHHSTYIPFSIADCGAEHESRIIETFLAILDVPNDRFIGTQVLAILENDLVLDSFGLAEDDMSTIVRWITDTRICWGIDGLNREQYGLPDFTENTWQAGLDRLFLGYAMAGKTEKIFADTLPYDHIEGSQTEILGKLKAFLERLFAVSATLRKSRPVQQWCIVLIDILDTFFASGTIHQASLNRSESEIQAIRDTILELGRSCLPEVADYQESIDIRVIQYYLKNSFKKRSFGFGFLTGGVTFCALLPMRSIPFKAIYVLGLNTDVFPRQNQAPGFDLIAKAPRPGDRSPRNDDRYLFLETLICARSAFIISFVGQSIVDNSRLPPSVMISELTDYIEKHFYIPNKKIMDHIVVVHRLQPFSPGYFDGSSHLFSYSTENCAAANGFYQPRESFVPFFSKGLTSPGEEWKTVDISQLINFYRHPAKYLLNHRLNVYWDVEHTLSQDKEPFNIDGLSRYKLGQQMVEKCIHGQDVRSLFDIVKASGQLPHGSVGVSEFERLYDKVSAFANKTRTYVHSAVSPLDIDLTIDGFRIIGRISSIYEIGLVRYRMAKINAKDKLTAWIYHLIYSTQPAPLDVPSTYLIGLKGKGEWCAWMFEPVKDSRHLLSDLLALYYDGLTLPLPFFPETSLVYAAEIIEKDRAMESALNAALKNWIGNDYHPGEYDDPYFKRCFESGNALNERFQQTALAVFAPLLEMKTIC